MGFTVVWRPSAEAQLAQIWLEASDRLSVTNAANAIDQELHHSPRTIGESRSEGRRVVIIRPLAVYFGIDDEDRIVRVLSVRKVAKDS